MNDLDGNKVERVEVETSWKRKRVELFDWLSDLNQAKKYLFNDQTHTDFVPFIINRGMSQNVETVMIANEMNKHSHCTKEMVHDFYYYILTKKKRFGKWAKQSTDNKVALDLLMRHYAINRKRAIEYLELMTSKDIETIKLLYETGGRT